MPSIMHPSLFVGTDKGLIIFRKKESGWIPEKVSFPGLPVSVVFQDTRNNCWWVCLAHKHWGAKLHRSFDEGKYWEPIDTPRYPEDALLRSKKPAKLRKIWCMAEGGASNPDRLYLGTEPGGLFRSDDGGKSFYLLERLWNHPSRKHEWFGAGRDEPFIHSIVVHPDNPDHFYVAISCAGVFETKDAGITWTPKNKGLIATYLPNPNVEIGHDPHLLLACRSQPEVMWQQNHCGIFRTTNGGEQWENVSGQGGFPYYGFALAIDHDDVQKAWVIPVTSDTQRTAVNLSLTVCQTSDGGKTWQNQQKGLPDQFAFDIVFRHSFDKMGSNLAFGTTTGNLFLSENEGSEWQCISNYLPRINYLAFSKKD